MEREGEWHIWRERVRGIYEARDIDSVCVRARELDVQAREVIHIHLVFVNWNVIYITQHR